MLFLLFLKQQMQQARRSSIWQKSLALNLFIGFFVFIMLIQFITVSVLLAKNWHEIVEVDAVLFEFYKIVGWYFAGMFAFRFFMQQTPVMAIQPYQHLPIHKSYLVHFVLFKGLFNVFNLFGIIFFLPFAMYQISHYHGTQMAWLWLFSMLAFDLFINYTAMYLKKQQATNIRVVLIVVAFIGVLALGDVFGWYSYSSIFATALAYITETPVLLIIPFVLLFLAYRLNFSFLKSHFYMEENVRQNESTKSGANLSYLERFGMIGEIMGLDVRLFIRNKRTKTILYLTPLFILYGLFFYVSDSYAQDDGFMVFVGIFMTGGVMFNYLQHAFSYEGSYFDMLLASRVDFKDYIRAKILGGTILTVASFILIIPYVYFGWFIMLINTATFLFNLGVVLPMLVYIATYNTKSMDLSKSTAFNFQGIGATHYLTMIPVFIVPLILYLPFKWFGNADHGVYLVGLTGLLGLAFRKPVIQKIFNNFEARKYTMAAGFREKD
jgi:hypothetical protein